MKDTGLRRDAQENADVQIAPAGDELRDGEPEPWEEIEPGRFMPRRIRGSFRGGKLG